VFRAKDGYLTIGATGEKRWPLFCRLLDAEEWLDDPRFQTNGDRYEHRLALAELIDEKLQARTVEEWERFFNDAGIPAGPVYAMDSALDHPQVRHREMVVSRPHPVLGEVSLLGLPVKLSETPGGVYRTPPELGEHTEAILREIGVPDDELARLREQEIV
jgi:CoA:oxalate CoA-transferase